MTGQGGGDRRPKAAFAVACAAGLFAAGPAQAALPDFGDGLQATNGSWLLQECRSEEQRRRDRCDGFIQGVAAVLRARRFPYCQERIDSSRLREAVVPKLSGFDRTPAARAVEVALNQAFPCRIPAKPAPQTPAAQ